MEIDNIKRQMLQQEIAFNIQQTDALTRLVNNSIFNLVYKINFICRSLSPGGPDQGSFVQSSSQHSNFDTHSLSRRSIKSRMSPMESNHAKVVK